MKRVRSKQRRARRRAKRPRGPKPSITLAVVKRVSAKVARGVTLKVALAAEDKPAVNLNNWKQTLRRHPKLYPHYRAARAQFLAWALERLVEAKSLRYLCWVLERRYPKLFARPAPVQVHIQQEPSAGIPEDVLERARALAREQYGDEADRGGSATDGTA